MGQLSLLSSSRVVSDGIDSVTSESKSVLAWLLSVREEFDLRLSSLELVAVLKPRSNIRDGGEVGESVGILCGYHVCSFSSLERQLASESMT